MTQEVEMILANQTPQTLKGIRVLVLLGGSELFGHERATIEIFRSLSQLGLQVRFVISSRAGHERIAPYLDQLGLDWIDVPFGYHWYYFQCAPINIWSVIKTSVLLWVELNQWHPTHLYTGNWLCMTYTAPLILWSSIPFVYRAGDDLHSSTFLHRWFNYLIFRRARHVVCNCQFLVGQLTKKLPFLKPVVIYNYPPVRPNEANFTQLPQVPQNAKVVLYVGQMSEHKGVPLLISSMSNLLHRGYNAILWIVGNAKYNPELMIRLRAEVADSGLEQRIYFFGYVNNIKQLFERADIHVCPSIWNEPSPNVVFEAKQAGVPSVVFPVGGIPELIEHKIDGYICQDTTSQALLEGLSYFLDKSKEREQAADAARRSFHSRFNYENFQRQWTEVFRTPFESE